MKSTGEARHVQTLRPHLQSNSKLTFESAGWSQECLVQLKSCCRCLSGRLCRVSVERGGSFSYVVFVLDFGFEKKKRS